MKHRLRESSPTRLALDAMKSMAANTAATSADCKKCPRSRSVAAPAYLAAVKENNGAAMSGRNTAFIDIYIERDLQKGLIDEKTTSS